MLRVLCVLKSGGDFDQSYVERLARMVEENLTLSHSFECFTDLPLIPGIRTIKLMNGYAGWWNKIELYQITGPLIYFDLDTLIVGNIDALGEALVDDNIFMLKPFARSELWATGIMAWAGVLPWAKFRPTRAEMNDFEWDQRYVSSLIKDKDTKVNAIQDVLTGICSYKHHCRSGLPDDARVVCFHGHPRPHEVTSGWVRELWG